MSIYSYLNNDTTRIAKRKLSDPLIRKLSESFQGSHNDDHVKLWKKKLEDVQLEIQKLRREVGQKFIRDITRHNIKLSFSHQKS